MDGSENGRDIKITVENGKISPEEADWYRRKYSEEYPDKAISEIIVRLDEKDPEYADVKCVFSEMPFERIRRITGYLVGTLDRFNDAKRAEEKARVKHGTACGTA